MSHLDKLSINLQECPVIRLIRILSKFYEKRSFSLNNFLSKSNIKTSKCFLQAYLATITKAHKL